MKTSEIISKLEEVVETLQSQVNENNTEQEDEWYLKRRNRYCTGKKDKYIVRYGYGDNKAYFTCYEEARKWIAKDMETYSGQDPIPEYAIDFEETYTIEFILPRKKKSEKTGLFGHQRAPDDEYKGVTDVWID
jgi:hypothetical protein